MKAFNFTFIFLSLILLIACGEDNISEEGENGGQEQEKPVDPESIVNKQTLTKGITFPKGKELSSLCVIDGNSLNDDQSILIATLQGLAAKISSEQIFIEEGGATTTWKNYLSSKYGVHPIPTGNMLA